MDARDAFQFGFLLRCAEEGLTAPEAARRAQEVFAHARPLVKQAAEGGLMDYVKMPLEALRSAGSALSAVGPAVNTAALVGLGLPIVVGGGLGYGAARLMDDDTDVDRAKSDEIVSEYRRLTEHLQRQRQLREQRERGLQLGSGVGG